MIPAAAFREKWPLLALGFFLAFFSGPGQTYFISLSAGGVREAFGLSDGGYGAIYSFATLCSAASLIWLGQLADRVQPARLALGALFALSLAALAMAGAQTVAGLIVAVFALRLAGQGMLSHLMATYVARWFAETRGRALGLAALGFSAGEASLPAVTALALGAYDWRVVWTGVAAALVVIGAPLILLLSRAAGGLPGADWAGGDQAASAARDEASPAPSWTRAQVLRDRRFLALMPGVLASPAIVTGALFHQVRLVETKGWALTDFARLYPLYAVAATGAMLGFGALIDRVGAARALPLMLAPLAAGLLLISAADAFAAGAAFMALIGASAGAAAVAPAALWSEMYGLAQLGAIRALSSSAMVFGTALSPAAIGVLIDRGVAIEAQFAALGVYALAAMLGFAVLSPRLAYRAPPEPVAAGGRPA